MVERTAACTASGRLRLQSLDSLKELIPPLPNGCRSQNVLQLGLKLLQLASLQKPCHRYLCNCCAPTSLACQEYICSQCMTDRAEKTSCILLSWYAQHACMVKQWFMAETDNSHLLCKSHSHRRSPAVES